MFNSPFSIKNPIKKSKSSEYGAEGYWLYKVKTNTKKTYIIRIEIYPNNLYFIKFYPKKHETNPNKYKLRLNQKVELSRLIATCIEISRQILTENPDSCFGFYGQWDEKDVIEDKELDKIEKSNLLSQRYRIYKRVVMSIINPNSFKFYFNDEINTMIIIPVHIYNNKKSFNKLISRMKQIHADDFTQMRVPSQSELKTFNL